QVNHLNLIYQETTIQEKIDISTESCYEKVAVAGQLPSTSQPPIGMFIDLYEKLAEHYEAIISVHLSKQISVTFDTAISAGNMIEGATVYPFDSGLSCMLQGFFAIVAAEMAAEGNSRDDILPHLENMKTKSAAYFMVDDLSHLKRGGRLTGAQQIIGGLLNIKPVLHMPEGPIVP